MKSKKNILTSFAIFVAMLMLTLPCIAGPVREKTTMDAVESRLVEDDFESRCSLCANEVPDELLAIQQDVVSVIQQDLDSLEGNDLISEEESSEILDFITGKTESVPSMLEEYTGYVYVFRPLEIMCDFVGALLWITLLMLMIIHGVNYQMPESVTDLEDWYEENCFESSSYTSTVSSLQAQIISN